MSKKNAGHSPSPPGTFVHFEFFSVDPQWRRLSPEEKAQGRAEFAETVQAAPEDLEVRCYSTLGLREDAQLLLWLLSSRLEAMEEFTGSLYQTSLGRYVEMSYSFLAMTRESIYTKDHHQQVQHHTSPIHRGDYLFVYPFVKSRDWYRLPFDERKRMMEEHMRVGHEFPNVWINTCYSFGLDDQDFVVAFETNAPQDFLNLVMKLRGIEASQYTVRDTPMFTCIKRPLEDILGALG